jgi:hypothetical protein
MSFAVTVHQRMRSIVFTYGSWVKRMPFSRWRSGRAGLMHPLANSLFVPVGPYSLVSSKGGSITAGKYLRAGEIAL